jgi:hypothetical protein
MAVTNRYIGQGNVADRHIEITRNLCGVFQNETYLTHDSTQTKAENSVVLTPVER